MKIGIITVHRAYNYGSVLQCYALQEYLSNHGHDVWIIDYRQKWTEAVYKPFSLYYIRHFILQKDFRAVIDYWRKRKSRTERLRLTKKIFQTFMRRFRLTPPCKRTIPKDFDVYLIGSDQLWSHQCVGGEDQFYLGKFKHSEGSKIIGFSLSASIPSLHKFGSERLRDIIANFDKLSVREQGVSEQIMQLTGISLPITIDPTLLVNKDLWDSMVNHNWKSRNYIATYQARPVAGDPDYLDRKACELANKMKCEIIDLSLMKYTVEDFISIIKYARCILTTSYHATVFSVLMETPCYAIKLGDGFDVRYTDLLTELGLEAELVEKDFIPTSPDIDFCGIRERIDYYRKSSEEFLVIN